MPVTSNFLQGYTKRARKCLDAVMTSPAQQHYFCEYYIILADSNMREEFLLEIHLSIKGITTLTKTNLEPSPLFLSLNISPERITCPVPSW